jgi:hypothetical protein
VIAGRHVRLTKTGQVRRHKVKALGKERDQITEHVAGAWEAMQQKERGSIGPTGFSIEYLEAVDFGRAVIDGGHGRLPEEVSRARGVGKRISVPGVSVEDRNCSRRLN